MDKNLISVKMELEKKYLGGIMNELARHLRRRATFRFIEMADEEIPDEDYGCKLKVLGG